MGRDTFRLRGLLFPTIELEAFDLEACADELLGAINEVDGVFLFSRFSEVDSISGNHVPNNSVFGWWRCPMQVHSCFCKSANTRAGSVYRSMGAGKYTENVLGPRRANV